jgi:hypothetical protein
VPDQGPEVPVAFADGVARVAFAADVDDPVDRVAAAVEEGAVLLAPLLFAAVPVVAVGDVDAAPDVSVAREPLDVAVADGVLSVDGVAGVESRWDEALASAVIVVLPDSCEPVTMAETDF